MVVVGMLMLHVFILIISIPSVKLSQELFRNHSDGITWDRAQDECNPHGLENREEFLRESGIPNEHEFWIGKVIYRVKTRWIEIIGCFEIAGIHVRLLSAVPSIGYCQEKCYSENIGGYFGYIQRTRDTQIKNCACLSNGVDETHKRDIKYCLNSTDSFVYRDYNGSVRQSSDPGNCTTICCGTCNGINGNHLEGRRCSSEDNTIVGRCGTQQNSGFKWNLDYYGSLNYCMHRNRLLSSSDYCQIKDKKDVYQGQLSWTNVFREEIEIIRTQDISEDPERCVSGVFTTVQGQRTLNMTEHNCNEAKYWYICKTNSSLYNMYTTEVSLFNTKPGLRNIHRGQENITTSYEVAVVGGVLGACFILTVSTILIVCKIRSKGIFQESDKHENRKTSQLHSSKTMNQDSTNTRNRKLNDLCETGVSGYSVVNNLEKPEDMKEIYNDAADGEYDILHGKQNKRMCPTENVYHSHGTNLNEDCLTYDSADFGKRIRNSNDGNGLYDTSFSVVERDYLYMSYKNRDNEITTDIYDKST